LLASKYRLKKRIYQTVKWLLNESLPLPAPLIISLAPVAAVNNRINPVNYDR
jgi:hypothetical protein